MHQANKFSPSATIPGRWNNDFLAGTMSNRGSISAYRCQTNIYARCIYVIAIVGISGYRVWEGQQKQGRPENRLV